MTFLMGSIAFYKNTNKYPRNDVSEYSADNFKKLLSLGDDCYIIQFLKRDGFWVCENNQQVTKLDLTGYLFQQSYLVSFAVRNLRYPLVSKKLPYKYLFKNKFLIKENLKVKLVMIDGAKKVEKMIVKDGVSKYGFIAKRITISPFYLDTLSNRSYQSIRNFKSYIDEKRYKTFYIKRK